MRKSLALWCQLLALAAEHRATTAAPTWVPPLVPQPRLLELVADPGIAAGPFSSVSVVVGGAADPAAAAAFAAEVAAAVGLQQTAEGVPELRIELLLQPEPVDSPPVVDAHGPIAGHEAYTLELRAGGRMTIAAEHAAGLFYGTRTALQLLSGGASGAPLPPIRISDAPVSSYRGLMIDNIRQAHNASFHSMMLDKMAAVKMNVYQLHASDTDGYSMPSKVAMGDTDV